MGLLDRFEQSIERLLEGTTGSLFRQKLEPVEIGKRLERAMMSNQRVSVDAKLVPNAYVVYLNPEDFDQIQNFQASLAREMESWLASVASRHHLTVLDRITVNFIADPATGTRNPRVEAEISDQPRRPPARPQYRGSNHRGADPSRVRPVHDPPSYDGTSVINIPHQPTSASSARAGIRLEVISGALNGQVFDVPEGTSTIGRASNNTITMNVADVSRMHAKFERNGQHLRIYDQNSTNGTRVNGETVHISDIQDGDQLQIGSQILLVNVGNEQPPANRKKWW